MKVTRHRRSRTSGDTHVPSGQRKTQIDFAAVEADPLSRESAVGDANGTPLSVRMAADSRREDGA
jgi:hypothetical protein